MFTKTTLRFSQNWDLIRFVLLLRVSYKYQVFANNRVARGRSLKRQLLPNLSPEPH